MTSPKNVQVEDLSMSRPRPALVSTPQINHLSQITPAHHRQFRAILAWKPDATLAELKAATGLTLNVGQICRALRNSACP